ncbi:hypothetical protein [Pedobacter planticolens]|nr:hypothetical protein [Pedobacter planticolens]
MGTRSFTQQDPATVKLQGLDILMIDAHNGDALKLAGLAQIG